MICEVAEIVPASTFGIREVIPIAISACDGCCVSATEASGAPEVGVITMLTSADVVCVPTVNVLVDTPKNDPRSCCAFAPGPLTPPRLTSNI